MAQVKKEDVRTAILEASFALIAEKGYVGASMTQIAKRAGISNANIYNYFGSKLDVFFSLYEQWLEDKIERLEARVNLAGTPEEKCRCLLDGLLREIPTLDNGFANNLIQAISTAGPDDSYNPELREWLEHRIELALKTAVPKLEHAHARRKRLAHFLVIAFDGCKVNFRINPTSLPDEKLMQDLVAMLLA